MRVTTPEFRVSFPAVFKPKDQGNGTEKYGLVLLFPKGADISRLKQAAEKVAREKWGSHLPANLNTPFHDQGEKQYAGYEPGATFINVKSDRRPGIIGPDYEDITDPADFYAGCWAKATLVAAAYDWNGKKGITFYLNNLMKTRDDERLDGGKSALEDFAPPEKLGELQTAGAGAGSIFD